MKKVLILAYDFPPYNSVGGLRPYNWYKYFQNFDIYPIIVTRQWDNTTGNEFDYISPSKSDITLVESTDYGTIIRTPYKANLSNRLLLKYGNKRFKFLRKLISGYFEIAQFIWICGPKKNLYTEARSFLRKNSVDAIIATGDPFVLFKYAKMLSQKSNVPWVADYRDPWSSDIGLEKKYLLRLFYKFIEKKTINSASLITIPSEFFKFKIRKLTDNTIELLPNGYDPELIESISTIIPSNQVLSIGFIGTIYKWHPVESVLNILDNYVKTKGSDCLRLSFVGINNLQEIEKLIGSNFNNLKEIITLEPKMSNEKILNKAAQFDVLLLFNDFSIIGTKIYDYLGLKRPILFCYSEDESSIKLMNKYFIEKFGKSVKLNVQEQLIRKKNAGFIIKNSEQLILILDSIIEEHKKTGSVKCHTIDSEEFSRRNQTKKLAELIHEIV